MPNNNDLTAGFAKGQDAIFHQRVLPALGVRGGGISVPRWFFICGQQGSGKTTLADRLAQDLGSDRTQRISVDDLTTLLSGPEDDPGISSPDQKRLRQRCIDGLAEHATSLGAHVIWEAPGPGEIEGVALVARALGYRTECLVLALPRAESWLATLHRSLESGGPTVRWDFLCSAYRRWPALLARAEAAHGFDRVAILDREGTLCYENQLLGDGRDWVTPPFGFESLVIERARARTRPAIDAMLADWQAIRTHPGLAFRNHPAWAWDSLTAFDNHLREMATDPATFFDLNDPHPVTAPRWITRLRDELDDILAGPEAEGQPDLPARAGRLVALVSQIAGQPTR